MRPCINAHTRLRHQIAKGMWDYQAMLMSSSTAK
ncbi:hypothetical protein ABIA03_001093 [Bradyrhizobium yuanmingense]|uniref:Uncharacterized protein n=1 Tax=Bradyrhizobium yuanmingense TaxID=108015 RepID=A0ABV4GM99_9BRAD